MKSILLKTLAIWVSTTVVMFILGLSYNLDKVSFTIGLAGTSFGSVSGEVSRLWSANHRIRSIGLASASALIGICSGVVADHFSPRDLPLRVLTILLLACLGGMLSTVLEYALRERGPKS